MRNRPLLWLVRVAFIVVVFYLLFTRIDLGGVMRTLVGIDLRYLLPVCAAFYITVFLFALQMHLTLRPLGFNLRLSELFKIYLVTNFYSMLLPGDIAGGGVTFYKLTRGRQKWVEAGTAIIYLRLANTLVMVAVGTAAVWLDSGLRYPALRWLAVGLLSAALIAFSPFVSTQLNRWMRRIIARVQGLFSPDSWLRGKLIALNQTVDRLQALETAALAGILAISLVLNGLAVLSYCLLAMALNVDAPLLVLAWVYALVNLLRLIPITISGLGLREASMVLILRDYAVPGPQALALSLAIFATAAVCALAGGVWDAAGWLSRRLRKNLR